MILCLYYTTVYSKNKTSMYEYDYDSTSKLSDWLRRKVSLDFSGDYD